MPPWTVIDRRGRIAWTAGTFDRLADAELEAELADQAHPASAPHAVVSHTQVDARELDRWMDESFEYPLRLSRRERERTGEREWSILHRRFRRGWI